jgi:heme oxygenase
MARQATLLERLKIETRAAHDRIERSVGLERRLASLAAYRQLLERFHGFHASFEPAAAPLIADREFFLRRCKTHHLVRDLRALGLSDTGIARLPKCDPLMPMRSRPAVLGALYVVEGSTLGGALIAREVERVLGFTAENGCAYFRSYGASVAAMWRTFGTSLLSWSRDEDGDEIVASANRTFQVMEQWLVQAGPA